jgi:hypothetical protein
MLNFNTHFPDNLPIISLNDANRLPQVGSYVTEYLFDNDNYFTDFDNSKIYDYIINDNYDMIIGRGHYKMNKKKDSLISAGRVRINKKIVYIDNDSGHYNPSEKHLLEVIAYFNSIGLLDSDYEFKNIDNQL